ncbi:MAG: hypothetical protein HOW73_12225 [Polyangiaceae bacterium]|nr:hypothetical protein [Polyangiaceae bacterium]
MRFLAKSIPVAASLATALALVALEARADQCMAVSATQADQAVSILNQQKDVREHCAPCKDNTTTSYIVDVARHETRGKSGDLHIVTVKDAKGKVHELDLAYTYVRLKGDTNKFTNLAALVGCPAEGVPAHIDGAGNHLD